MLEKIKCTVSTDEHGRIYTVNGVSLPSVTTMLGKTASKESVKTLENWLARPGNKEEAARARDRGTRLHAMVEKFLLGGDYKDVDGYQSVLPLYRQIFPQIQKISEVFLLEAPLHSPNLGVAGTVDIVAKIDGKVAVIDLKTSTKFKRPSWLLDYLLQETAYKEMVEETYGLKIEALYTIMAVEAGFSKGMTHIEKPNNALLNILKGRIARFEKMTNG